MEITALVEVLRFLFAAALLLALLFAIAGLASPVLTAAYRVWMTKHPSARKLGVLATNRGFK